MFNDPIADFLTRIRNAGLAGHRYVEMDWNKMVEGLAEILKKEGFIKEFLVKKSSSCRGTVRMFLKYDNKNRPLIQKLLRKSKLGLRKYIKSAQIKPVCGGMGISILSTPKGLMTGREAVKENVGGELLCEIW